MSYEIRSNIDVDSLRKRSIKTPYPNLFILDLNSCVPVVVSCLEDGDLPLLATYKGETKIIKKISLSVYNISKLLRVTSLRYYNSNNDFRDFNNIISYMEVVNEWI